MYAMIPDAATDGLSCQVLYSRFLSFKNLAVSMPNRPSKSTTTTTASSDVKVSMPLLSQVDERIAHAEHYYELMLESSERLFDNEIDQHGFEEQMRYMFGYKVCFHVSLVACRAELRVIGRIPYIHNRQGARRVHQASATRAVRPTVSRPARTAETRPSSGVAHDARPDEQPSVSREHHGSRREHLPNRLGAPIPHNAV